MYCTSTSTSMYCLQLKAEPVPSEPVDVLSVSFIFWRATFSTCVKFVVWLSKMQMSVQVHHHDQKEEEFTRIPDFPCWLRGGGLAFSHTHWWKTFDWGVPLELCVTLCKGVFPLFFSRCISESHLLCKTCKMTITIATRSCGFKLHMLLYHSVSQPSLHTQRFRASCRQEHSHSGLTMDIFGLSVWSAANLQCN